MLLPHASINSNGKVTVLFIHGAFSSKEEWDMVVPYMPSTYHLLVPDLPAHGDARQIKPFSVARSVDMLAELIRTMAKDQRACLVGLSLGAHVAIDLASQYPELVNDVFVSGFEVFPPSVLSPYLPQIVWVMIRSENLVPRILVRWLMDGADVQRIDCSICTLSLCRQIVNPINSTQWPSSWLARTLVVAAGKGGIVPSKDHPADAKKLVEIALNKESIAVTEAEIRHPWNRQLPRLFAKTACAWFERKELPTGFQKLV
ncbi:LANO_0A00144g1_1 [Lachancea nothofagi CBS 11611]|uniref:LANO_0A00144g1_1 n=1 Tax=Lachancea nothofagi CBS 11611 TaxID=1266666 RepID=A0A1G4ILE5_9SACH|nr:LANO_0A00144g1_1 [Lachancea nothofagi CBS 11611]